MYFKYCNECNTKECEYISVQQFIKTKLDYSFCGCPDKEDSNKAEELLFILNPIRERYIQNNGKHCTADLRFIKDNNEEIYVEVKRVFFGHQNRKNDRMVGLSKSMLRIYDIVFQCLMSLDDRLIKYIQENYYIVLNKAYISESGYENFDSVKIYV